MSLSPTTDPIRKNAENARFFMHLAVHAFRSYDECEGSEGLRVRAGYQDAMRREAWRALAAARALRAARRVAA